MSLDYIRKSYGVPAKRGMRVIFTNTHREVMTGVIRSARGQYLRVLMDGEKRPRTLHPTWRVEYVVGAEQRRAIFGDER